MKTDTPWETVLKLAREIVARDDRNNQGSRILRLGLTDEYQVAKALLSAQELLDREGIDHDGTRKADAELDRILSMSDEEVRQSLLKEGIDPELAAYNSKYAIAQVVKLVDLRRENERLKVLLSERVENPWRLISTRPKVEERTEILVRFAWHGRDGKNYAEHAVALLWPDGVISDTSEEPIAPGERETITHWMPIPT